MTEIWCEHFRFKPCVLKQAGKVLGWKEKEDMEGDPLILIRFSPDHSPEGLGFFLELEDAGDDLGLRELSAAVSSAHVL